MPPKRACCIVFIHGLARKPAPEKLAELWLWGLKRDDPMPNVFASPNPGVDLPTRGVPHLFYYYADVFYGTDYDVNLDSYYEANEALEIRTERLDEVEADLDLPKPVTPRERAFLRNLEAKLTATAALTTVENLPPRPDEAHASEYEIASWLPAPVKQAIIKKAAMEAYYFLFDKEYTRSDNQRFRVRQELRRRLLDELKRASELGSKLVIVAHSMGTMVAYDVLRNCPACPPVDVLITVGSPLGIREIQEELIAVDADDVDFPATRLGRWINIYDPLDPVCGADPKLANDYRPVNGKKVVDLKESNWGKWRHTVTHYLAGSQFRGALIEAVGARPGG